MIDYTKIREELTRYILDNELTKGMASADLHAESITYLVEEIIEEELTDAEK